MKYPALNLSQYANEFIPQSVVCFKDHNHIKEVLEQNGYKVTYSGELPRYELAHTACGYSVSRNGYCSHFASRMSQPVA